MQISRLTIANFMIAMILLSSPFIVQLTSSATYDPWADLDGDGDIDIFDVVTMTGRYGTKGDATKNVNVTNWPRSTAVVVFDYEVLWDGAYNDSIEYDANGFRYMHILIDTVILDVGESVDIELHSSIYASTRCDILCYTVTLTHTFYETDIVLHVPSDNFYFRADAVGKTSVAVYMSYYLT